MKMLSADGGLRIEPASRPFEFQLARPVTAAVAPQQQTFTVASEYQLVCLIREARDRLVVVAPALPRAVAQALARRCADQSVSITVVLDADAEVYRLGYGDPASLELLRHAMTEMAWAWPFSLVCGSAWWSQINAC